MTQAEYEAIRPRNTGDCYLLVGYPADGMATLGFAYWRFEGGRGVVYLDVDDGDQFRFDGPDDLDCYRVVLVRWVRDGLVKILNDLDEQDIVPANVSATALRYEKERR